MKKLMFGMVLLMALFVGETSSAEGSDLELDFNDYFSFNQGLVGEEYQDSKARLEGQFYGIFPDSEKAIFDKTSFLKVDAAKKIDGLLYFGDVGIRSLEGLQNFSNVKELNAMGDNNFSNFYPLAGMTSLESITIDTENAVSDLAAFSHLKNLKILYMKNYGHKVYNDEPITNLDELLKYSETNVALTDLSPLNDLQNLETININVMGYLPKVKILKNASTLRYMNPVILSDQFYRDETLETRIAYTLIDNNNQDFYQGETTEDEEGYIEFKNITQDTKYILCTISTHFDSSNAHYFSGYYYIPLYRIDK